MRDEKGTMQEYLVAIMGGSLPSFTHHGDLVKWAKKITKDHDCIILIAKVRKSEKIRDPHSANWHN